MPPLLIPATSVSYFNRLENMYQPVSITDIKTLEGCKYNHDYYWFYKRKGTIIDFVHIVLPEGQSFYQYKNTIAVLDVVAGLVIYFCEYQELEIHGELDNETKALEAIYQSLVWEMPGRIILKHNILYLKEIVSKIMLEHWLTEDRLLLSDKHQTPMGAALWNNIIRQSYRHDYVVYKIVELEAKYIGIFPCKMQRLERQAFIRDMSDLWSIEHSKEKYRLLISKKEL